MPPLRGWKLIAYIFGYQGVAPMGLAFFLKALLRFESSMPPDEAYILSEGFYVV